MANYSFDPAHSELTFRVRHMMISNVKGSFDKFNITLNQAENGHGEVVVTIDAASINTNNTERDTHLKSADFFEVEKYPEITFKSSNVNFKEDGKLTGTLTIKGISKDITLDVEAGGENKDPWGNLKVGFSVSGKINRKDFGLNWNAVLEAGGVMVSDEVSFNAEVQFTKS